MQVSSTNTHLPADIQPIYPFASHWLNLPAGRMHYLDEGHGPPVVLLHGNPTWSFYYRRLVTALRPHHRVIVPDHLGCGLSDKPQGYRYRLSDHIDNLAALLRHLNIGQASMVVHDWGGAIGFGAAVRGALQVQRVVVLNTAAFLSWRVPLRIAVCKLPGLGALAIRGLNGFAGLATIMATTRRMEPAVRRGYLLPYRNWHDRVANLRFVQDIPLHPRHPTWPVVAAIDKGLGQFRTTPMLILWGGRDWCFSDHFLAGWLRRFPDAQVQRYDDAGHYVLEDAHEQIIPAVGRFLGIGLRPGKMVDFRP